MTASSSQCPAQLLFSHKAKENSILPTEGCFTHKRTHDKGKLQLKTKDQRESRFLRGKDE